MGGCFILGRNEPAVDGERLPGDVTRRLGRQEHDAPFEIFVAPSRPSGVTSHTMKSMRSSVAPLIFDGKKPGQMALTLTL